MNNNNLHAQSAVEQNGGHSRPNLSHPVIGTARMGQILPVLSIPLVPGDNIHVHHNCFTRTLPLSVPAYATITYRTLALFVPYHQVMSSSDSFFDNQKHSKGWTNTLPLIRVRDIFDCLADNIFSSVQSDPMSVDYDFEIEGTGSTVLHRKLKPKGLYAVKLLQLLGLNLQFTRNTNDVHVPVETTASQEDFNALPILAFAHAYNSYMSYAPHYNESELSKLIEGFTRNTYNRISSANLKLILSSILLTYEDSFFSILWNDPTSIYNVNGVSSALENYIKQTKNPSDLDDILTSYLRINEKLGASVEEVEPQVNAAAIRNVLRFDSYLRRSNYSGSKDIEQLYSRFGIKIEDYMARYPHYIKESASNVQIGDVTATADAGDIPVGGYAGKAIGTGDLDFKYHASDYGMLFVFAWYAPKPIYFTGIDKEFMRVQPLDFYTPEFDTGDSAAVSSLELDAQDLAITAPSTIGFAPLYSQYLFHQARIFGDMRRFAGYDNWHFGREHLGDVAAQSDLLIYMPNDGTEFERIFNIEDASLVDTDTLIMNMYNDVECYRPMKDFTGKAGLGAGDIQVNANGNNIN